VEQEQEPAYWWVRKPDGSVHVPKQTSPWWTTAADGQRVVLREPEHAPKGDPCEVFMCGLPASRHRQRGRRTRSKGDVAGQKRRQRQRQEPERREAARAKRLGRRIVGIDGEGEGRAPHRYTYLSAVDEHGVKLGSVSNRAGLSTLACLKFFESVAEQGVGELFGYSLGYDLAMILRDLPDNELYDLVHPDSRGYVGQDGRSRRKRVYWNGWRFDFLRRRFEAQRVRWDKQRGRSIPLGPRIVIWDVFQFYQGKFTKALTDWKVGAEEVVREILWMKSQRSHLENMPWRRVTDYCDTECHLLALLMRHLIEAHEAAELPLKVFYGAGSTSSALLNRMGVRKFIAEPPERMQHAVACGFFGGRFELSRIGAVRTPCFAHDISSAYPYAMTFLPCLTCGRWERVRGRALRGRVERARLALVHCRVRHHQSTSPTSWGPLPFRLPNGTIQFPLRCDGTWVWKEEYLAAVGTLWPGVQALEAWVYDTDCDCAPFAKLPETYNERCRLGKDGPGIVLKLGMNGAYGKTAQSQGDAPFRSWVYASNITSTTRAQLLHAIAAADDPASVLMLATDGVLATERLTLPEPRETGTSATGKPLGGWEVKEVPCGAFLARPGIYWPLDATETTDKDVRARGISRAVTLAHSARVVEHFERHGWQVPYDVNAHAQSEEEKVVRFVGLRQGIRRSARPDRRTRQYTYTRDDHFADWLQWPMQVTFDPQPKRAYVRDDLSLACHPRVPGESAPYDNACEDPETLALREEEEMRADQPDGDLTLG
jgi:hypothetical protein